MWKLTYNELYALGLGPLFERPPAEPGEGGGAAVADPPADEESGDEPAEPEKSPFDQKLEQIEQSEDLSELTEGDEDAFELQDVEDEPEESEEPAEEAAAEVDEDFELPEGWKRTETGKIQRPNGEWATKAEIEALRSGEDVETVSTTEEGAEEALEGEADEDGPLTVSVPGREPDDEDVELPIDVEALEEAGLTPDEAKERVQQLRNGYMRRQELNRHLEQIETDRTELEVIEQQLAEAPADFILGHVDPEIQASLATRILATMPEERFSAVIDRLAGWQRDPTKRREEALSLREEQLQRQEQLREDYRTRSSETELVVGIQKNVNSLIPESWPEGKARRFFRYGVTEIQDHLRENGVEGFDPGEVPQVLAQAGLLDDFGLSNDGEPTTGSSADPSASSAGSEEPAGEAEIEKAKRAGEETAKRAKRRKEAAATAPAGAGSSMLGGMKVPSGQSFEERINWLEKRLGLK